MLVYILMKIVYYITYTVTYVFLIMPDVAIPQDFSQGLHTGISYARGLNSFFPVGELMYTIIALFLLYEGSYFILKLVNWVIRKIPTIS